MSSVLYKVLMEASCQSAAKDNAMALEGKPGHLRIRSTEDGLHLDGSILWLDSERTGDLSFLSSPSIRANSSGPQFIATEETIKILEANHKRPKALICQYNRPFSIGRLKMELLPSGTVLGGALLHVELDNKRILYAPQVQTQKIATVRQMQLKKAHTLILNASLPDPGASFPNRKKEKDRLLARIQECLEKQQFPTILCQPTAIAQELTKFLSDHKIPLAVHQTIYRINKVYETYGSSLGSYSLHAERRQQRKVLLFPISRHSYRKPLPDGPVFVIHDHLDHPPKDDEKGAERFYLGFTCDIKELKEIIAAVAPKEVFLFGPYAKRYCEELKNCAAKIKPLYPNDQPTLF